MPLKKRNLNHRACGIAVLMLVLVVVSQIASAHAILVDSNPKQNSTIQGPKIEILLRFNVRIDIARSRVMLVSPDGSVVRLNAEEQPSPDTMKALAITSKAGDYNLLWQVLASDGHVSRGKVPFTVK